jgi:hypothetical protein
MARVLIFYAKPTASDRTGPPKGPNRPDACLVFWHDTCVARIMSRLPGQGVEVFLKSDEQMQKATVLSELGASEGIDCVVFLGHGCACPPPAIVNRRKAPSNTLVDRDVVLAGPRRCQCLLACSSATVFGPVAKQAQVETLLGFTHTVCAPKVDWAKHIPDPSARSTILGFHCMALVDSTIAVIIAPTHSARTNAVNGIKSRLRDAAEQLKVLYLTSGNTHIGAFATALTRNADSLCCLP